MDSWSFLQQDGVVFLEDAGLLQVTGKDAATFLQGQLTQDVQNFPEDAVRLAGYCTPKGRLFATFFIWKTAVPAEGMQLYFPAALLAGVQKRLSFFIMRAAVQLQDVSQDYAFLGILGSASSVCLPWFSALPPAPLRAVRSPQGVLLRLADASYDLPQPRYLWCAPRAIAQDLWPTLTSELTRLMPCAWHASEIAAGVAHITAQTQEVFLPHSLNYDVLGGVSFTKGCYPGQEIVARTHYLGKIKRRTIRAYLAQTQEAVFPGMEVFAEDSVCGQVVNTAPVNGQKAAYICLIEIQLAAFTQNPHFHLGHAHGPLLTCLPPLW